MDEAKLWMWQHQKNRRNLTAYQRGELALQFKDTIAAKAKERQRGGQGGTLLCQISDKAKDTKRELAEMAEVSHDTLAKVEYITEHADEETKAKLRRGDKGTTINKEYKRLKEQTIPSPVAPSQPAPEIPPLPVTETPYPPCPNQDVKYFPKTTLKFVDQETPRPLLVNLFEIFRKGFVEEMVLMAMDMLWEERGKETVKDILARLNKKFARKK
jgi:hypothetical protein